MIFLIWRCDEICLRLRNSYKHINPHTHTHTFTINICMIYYEYVCFGFRPCSGSSRTIQDAGGHSPTGVHGQGQRVRGAHRTGQGRTEASGL